MSGLNSLSIIIVEIAMVDNIVVTKQKQRDWKCSDYSISAVTSD